jgi:hypothetical protein
MGLVAGLILSLSAFYLCLGTEGVEPGSGRYALFALVPSAIAIGFLLNAAAAGLRWPLGGPWIAVALAWGMLASVQVGIFKEFRRTGGNANYTYRTAAIEPKVTAFRWITDDAQKAHTDALPISERSRPLKIIVECWSLYAPIRYLASQMPGTAVLTMPDTYSERLFQIFAKDKGEDIRKMLNSGAYLVTFAEPDRDAWFRKYFPDLPLEQKSIPDFSGRPLIHIWHHRAPNIPIRVGKVSSSPASRS